MNDSIAHSAQKVNRIRLASGYMTLVWLATIIHAVSVYPNQLTIKILLFVIGVRGAGRAFDLCIS